MLPTFLNNSQEVALPCDKSFSEALCDGYHFEIKNGIKTDGSRSLYYYKAEHSLLVSHFHSSRVHILNLETGKLRWFDHHGTTVRSIQVFNHEVITTSWDGTVCITGFDTLEKRMVLTEKGMGRCPIAAISPDHESVYSYSYDSDKNPYLTANTVREWSFASGRLKKTIQLPGTHLSETRYGCCKVYDNRLFVVSNTGHLHIYNCNTGMLLAEHFYYDQLQSMCLYPSFNLLVIGGSEGNIYLHDLHGNKLQSKRKAHSHDISYMLVHPDKPEIMISVSFDGTMKTWRLPDLELLESVAVNGDRLWNVTAVNDLLIAGGEAEFTCVYDIKNLPQVVLLGKLIFSDQAFAFMPNGSGSFYSNNPSVIQIRRDDDGTLLEGQMADYLLNTACDLKILKDLFSPENTDQAKFRSTNKGFLQITQ
jgi:WD40 repeat protein